MTSLAEHPHPSHPPPKPSPGTLLPGTAVRGGSYLTLPAGSGAARVEGTYATVASCRNLPPDTRGSSVTVAGAPTVAASVVESSYVKLPAAA